jgi:hypothetical protein
VQIVRKKKPEDIPRVPVKEMNGIWEILPINSLIFLDMSMVMVQYEPCAELYTRISDNKPKVQRQSEGQVQVVAEISINSAL